MSAETSKEVAHGVCRACSHRKHLVLPGRICHKCIERALNQAAAMSDEEILEIRQQMLTARAPLGAESVLAPVDPEDVFKALEDME